MKFGLCHSRYSCSNVEHCRRRNIAHNFLLEEVRSRTEFIGKGAWSRGWDLNPRMEVLQFCSQELNSSFSWAILSVLTA